MYALFPAFVSSLFLFYGVYVVTTRGRTRASLAFLGMTTLTCLWQGIWAFLFQTHDIGTAQVLAKLGWIAILVMPTMLYHFAVEVAEAPSERHWLLASYALDAALIALLLTTNLVIDGVHAFHFGFYPKAGVLEAVHIAQTSALVTRGMWVLYRAQRHATAEKRKRLLTCLFGVGLISLAAADYAVNYGVAFYPPGVLPLAIALGIIAVGVVKFDLMRPYALAATVAHEVRTPLASIRLQAEHLQCVLHDQVVRRHGPRPVVLPPGDRVLWWYFRWRIRGRAIHQLSTAIPAGGCACPATARPRIRISPFPPALSPFSFPTRFPQSGSLLRA